MELTRINALNCLGAVMCFIIAAVVGIRTLSEGSIAEHKPLLASLIFIGIILFNNTQNTKIEVKQ